MTINVVGMIFWVFMLVDLVKREFPKKDGKLMWLLIVLLTSYIGALIYYFLVKKKDAAR